MPGIVAPTTVPGTSGGSKWSPAPTLRRRCDLRVTDGRLVRSTAAVSAADAARRSAPDRDGRRPPREGGRAAEGRLTTGPRVRRFVTAEPHGRGLRHVYRRPGRTGRRAYAAGLHRLHHGSTCEKPTEEGPSALTPASTIASASALTAPPRPVWHRRPPRRA